MGDIPSGTYASVTDNSGNPLPYQIDSISPPWPDGSMRHAVYTVMVPATTGNNKARLQLLLQSGAYAPASTPRSINDITASAAVSHNYQIHYQGVQTHPTGSWPGPYAWSTYGSHAGNFTCNINNLISANQYEIRANGPVRLEAHVYGFMTDDGGGTDTHLYCDDWIDVYSDPSNSANVMYVEHMPLISQPIATPADGSSPSSTSPSTPDPNADFVIGQASLCDGNSTAGQPGCTGATKLRDFADDNLSLGPSNVTVSAACSGASSFSAPSGSPAPTRTAYKIHLVSGSLPSGLTEGQIAFSYPYNACQPSFALRGDEWTNPSGGAVTVTNTGSGSFQLIAQQSTPYYNGFFITQGTGTPSYSVGVPVMQGGTWTPPAGWFPEPDLDGTTNSTSTTACAVSVQTGCTQKAYWQQTGLVPGWDFSYQSTVQAFYARVCEWRRVRCLRGGR